MGYVPKDHSGEAPAILTVSVGNSPFRTPTIAHNCPCDIAPCVWGTHDSTIQHLCSAPTSPQVQSLSVRSHLSILTPLRSSLSRLSYIPRTNQCQHPVQHHVLTPPIWLSISPMRRKLSRIVCSCQKGTYPPINHKSSAMMPKGAKANPKAEGSCCNSSTRDIGYLQAWYSKKNIADKRARRAAARKWRSFVHQPSMPDLGSLSLRGVRPFNGGRGK